MPRRLAPSLRDVCRVFFRQWSTILLVFATAMLGAAVYAVLVPPYYSADVRILVKLGKEQLAGVAQNSQPAYNVLFQERTQNINNEIEILKKTELDRSAFERLKESLRVVAAKPRSSVQRVRASLFRLWTATTDFVLYPFYELGIMKRLTEDEKLVRDLTASLRYELVEDTDTLKLAFRWDDPDFAAAALQEIVSAYLAAHIEAHRNERSQPFYEDELKRSEVKLGAVEGELAGFLRKGSVANLAVQKEFLLKDVSDLDDRYGRAAATAETTRTRLRRVGEEADGTGWIETPLLGMEAGSPANSALQVLDDTYYKLQDERGRLLATHLPDAREVRALDARLSALRRQKAESLRSILGTQLATDEALAAWLGSELQARKQALEELNGRTVRLRQLERERDTAESSFLLYQKKAEELRINADLSDQQITSVRVVGQIAPPAQPAGPRRKLILGVAALVGLLLGIGLAGVLEFFDHTFRGADDVARVLGTPLLLSVPRDGSGSGGTALGLDAFLDLEQRLKAAAAGGAPAVGFVSCASGEGTTTVAYRFAEALAVEGGKRVLLVDANLRTPSLHERLQRPREAGLVEVLQQGLPPDEALPPAATPGLRLLTGGRRAETPALAFASPGLAPLVAWAKGAYDFVVLDTAPVGPYPETPGLCARLDAVVLVLEAERTRWEVARLAKARLEEAGGRLVGAILNKRRFHIPTHLYDLL